MSIAKSGLIENKNLINLMTCSFATKMRGTVTKNKKDSVGRRLGLKKTDGQEVFKNDILIRQRGFKYKPGENVHYGRDHTLVASKEGILKFTTLPWSNLKKVVVNVLEKEIPNRYIPAPTPFMYHPSLYPEEAKNNYNGEKLEVKNPGKHLKGNKLLKNRLEYSSIKENYLLGVEQNKANNSINNTNLINDNNIEVLNNANEDVQLLAKRSKNKLLRHRKNKFKFSLGDLVNDHLEKNYREYDKKYNKLARLPIKVKEINKADTLKDEKAEKDKIENKSKKQVKTNTKSSKMSKKAKKAKKAKKDKKQKSEVILNAEVINNKDETNTNTTEKINDQLNMNENENIDMNASEQLTKDHSNQNQETEIVSKDKDKKKLEKINKKLLKKVKLEIKEQDLLNKMNKSLISTYLSMKSNLLRMYLNSEPTAEEFSKKLNIYSSNKFYKSKKKVIRKMYHILNIEDLNKFLFRSNIKKLNSVTSELRQIINGFKILKLHSENVDIFKNDLYNFDKGISKKYNTLQNLNDINTKNLKISLKYDVKKCLNKCRSFFLFKFGFVINDSVDINKEYMSLEMLLSKIVGRLNFKNHNLSRLRSNILKVRTRRNIAIQKIVNGHKLIKRKDIIIIKDLKPNKFRVRSNGIKKSKIETLRKKNIRKYFKRKSLNIKREENKKKRLEKKAQKLKERKEEKEKKKIEKKEAKKQESKELNDKVVKKEAKNEVIKTSSKSDSKVGNKTNKIKNVKTSNNQKDNNKSKQKGKHPLKAKGIIKFQKKSPIKQKAKSVNTNINKTLKRSSKIKNLSDKENNNTNNVNKSEQKMVKKPLQSKSLKPKSKNKSKSPLIKDNIKQQGPENQNTQLNFDQNELNKSKNVKI